MTARGSSLQRRLSAAVIGITSAVVLVAAAGMWLASRAVILRGIDGDLLARGERLVRLDNGQAPWRRPVTGRSDPRRLLQVLDTTTGAELHRSAGLGEDEALAAFAQPSDRPATRTLGDGRALRVLSRRLPGGTRGDPPPAIAHLASDLDPVHAELARMAIVLAALWAAATVLAALAVAVLHAPILRPLRALTAVIDRLGPDDLSARVPSGAGPDEVRGVVERLNRLLDRLEQAFRREQATIATIAHELRTPVAALRATIEFRLQLAPGPDEAQVLTTCLGTVERMGAMVSNLLLLARLEAGNEPLPPERVALDEAVADAVDAVQPAAAARGIGIVVRLGREIAVDASPLHLRLVLDNLIGNAVAHAPRGATVTVTLARAAGTARLEIDNPLAAPLDASRLGETFYRADSARSGGDHSGLGLALCRRLVRLLDGTLRLETGEGRFRALVGLPLRAEADLATSPAGTDLLGGGLG